MVRPRTIISAIIHSLQQSDDIPSETNFVGYNPDINSESIKLPVIVVSTGPRVNLSDTNTDFIGHKTDDSGDEIGYIYSTLYTFELDVAVWTAHDSKYSPRIIGDAVRDVLYSHASSGPALPLTYPDDGSPIDDVWRFILQDGSQNDDLTTSPTLRRWEQTVTVSASERYVQDGPERIDAFDLTADTS